MPDNCRECEAWAECRGHYGGSLCRWKDEIYAQAMERRKERGEWK